MIANPFKNMFKPGPRGKIRWSVFGIAVLFLIMSFVDVIGSSNFFSRSIDSLLTATPLIRDLTIWPQLEINSSANTKNLKFKNIQSIDLSAYGLPFKLGLDLRGGAHLVYEADVAQINSTDRANSLSGVRDVIERRINALGVSEPVIQTDQVGDRWRVIVELAGVSDINQAIKIIGETPLLEFKEENGAASQLTAEQQTELTNLNKGIKDKAQNILKQILAGADFSALAKANSEDPGSKDNGGFYSGVKKGTFVPEYEEVIFNKLKVGEVYPELVQSQFGYHIIKKEATSGEGENLAIDTRHILFKTKTAVDLGIALEPEWKTTSLTGKQLKRASVEMAPNSGIPQVSLEFNGEGADLFAELTKKNTGKLLAIFLDGQPISIPRVNEPILSGQAVISGSFNLAEAKLLAQRLNAGALPVPIKLISQTTVGATLGNDSVQKSLIAGFWGLILVAIFMILYYRLPGLVAVLALLIYAVIVLALFKLVPVTLTLAGIAGFILSIGMAVDANVLIFERLKEELRAGRDLMTAVDQGFKRAWSSVRDSNVSSLITCSILFWFGSSIVKGFALTLAIGIIISMFSAITITRQFLRLIAKWPISRKIWLYGVKIK